MSERNAARRRDQRLTYCAAAVTPSSLIWTRSTAWEYLIIKVARCRVLHYLEDKLGTGQNGIGGI